MCARGRRGRRPPSVVAIALFGDVEIPAGTPVSVTDSNPVIQADVPVGDDIHIYTYDIEWEDTSCRPVESL